MPRGKINSMASRVNGIKKRDGKLFKSGEELEDVLQPRVGLSDFLDWINHEPFNRNKEIILVSISTTFYEQFHTRKCFMQLLCRYSLDL